MKIRITLFIVLIVLVFSQISKSQTTVSIRLDAQTGQDCLLTSIYPNSPAPNHPDLSCIAWTIMGNYFVCRSLFKFRLGFIPSNANVINARLSLYGNPTPGNNNHSGDNRSYLRRIKTSWDASTATWETQPDFTYIDQVPLERSISPLQDYLNIDVTILTRLMVNDPIHNFGFELALRLEDIYKSMNFASSENVDVSKRPKLDITYSLPGDINSTSTKIPIEYALEQNFPNPFNPFTTIKFDIPKSSFTSITIFDELGREVEKLVSENLNAGSFQINWDASNNNSGIYFYKLQSSDYIETKKMLLLK